MAVSKKTQNPNVFRSDYYLEANNERSDTTNEITISSSISVRLSIITNGTLYLMISKPDNISVMGQPFEYLDEPDTLLINAITQKCYYFKNKNILKLDTQNVYSDFSKFENGRNVMLKKDNLTILMDTIYPKCITPFPQTMGNQYGIIKIESPKQKWYLKHVEKSDFDFAPLITRSNGFKQTQEKLPNPFL